MLQRGEFLFNTYFKAGHGLCDALSRNSQAAKGIFFCFFLFLDKKAITRSILAGSTAPHLRHCKLGQGNFGLGGPFFFATDMLGLTFSPCASSKENYVRNELGARSS